MTIPEMLSQSGMLTILGMGVVFGFLIILIICMRLVELLVKLTGNDKDELNVSKRAPIVADDGQHQAVIAAIATAVNERQKK